MWVHCQCGRRHFGLYGAAGLVLSDRDGRVLMAHRSELVHYGGTWSFPGGALAEGETPVEAALREVDEELGLSPQAAEVVSTLVGLDHGMWRYTYVFAHLRPEWTDARLHLNWESDAAAWVAPADMADLPLHPDLRAFLPELHAALGGTAVS